MQLSMTARFLVAFVAGLLFGSALALLTFGPGPEMPPLVMPLLGTGSVLLGTVIVARPGKSRAGSAPIARDVATAPPRRARSDDVAAVVAALEALRRGHIAQGGGS